MESLKKNDSFLSSTKRADFIKNRHVSFIAIIKELS